MNEEITQMTMNSIRIKFVIKTSILNFVNWLWYITFYKMSSNKDVLAILSPIIVKICAIEQAFQIELQGGGIGNFTGGIFLSSGGNLRSDFYHLNLFQSYKHSFNIQHRLKSKLA